MKLMVISHERSGTHFLINTLANIFQLSNIQKDLHLTESDDNYESAEYRNHVQEHLKRLSENQEVIIKSHHHSAFFKDFDFAHYGITPYYIYRDVRDVMVSCHHYFNSHPEIIKKGTFPPSGKPTELAFEVNPTQYAFDSAYSFYRNKTMTERWCSHVGPYLEDDRFTKIKYEDLNLRFEETCRAVANKSDILRPTLGSRTVSARKGAVGDWKNYFEKLANERIISYTNNKGIKLECQ
jgi:hypothetical protein